MQPASCAAVPDGAFRGIFVVSLVTMRTDRDASVIERKVLIQAVPAVIYQALTEAKDLARWFCDRVTTDPRVGGELKAFWRIGCTGKAQRGCAVFTNLVPDSQVDLLWVDEGEGEIREAERHTISYTIRLKRGTSEVTVRDAGPPLADDETFELMDQGWITVLRDLKEHCETRKRSSRRRPAAEAQAE